MEGLSDDELYLRFGDCLSNQLILTEEGKIGFSGIDWMEKGTHILEEYSMRGSGLPLGEPDPRRFRVPEPQGLSLAQAIKKDYPEGIPKTFTLFKYGERQHLESFVDEGLLRLRPASSYNDSSLNPAIEDDELTFEKINGATRTQYSLRSDFYCYCSAWLHNDRLIGDFSADCVVAITDPHEFFIRLATALNETQFNIRFNRVTYVDPLLLGNHEIVDLAFIKHMRFAYQLEHRWVAFPPNTHARLGIRDLRLGELGDIARLYGV
jgi:hypothetical protein